MLRRGVVVLAALAALASAAPAAEPDDNGPPGTISLADLPGWRDEDHVGALRAVQAACAVARDVDLSNVCHQAAALDFLDEADAKTFLESHFRAEAVGGTGRLTGYYMPVYQASPAPIGEFTAPVRPAPADLPARDASSAGHAFYPARAAIEARPTDDALAWMRPEDLFFMQIQGSGVLAFTGGLREKAVFAGDNGAPFVGIAAPMKARGLLGDQETSGEAIHAWLAEHRGPDAEAIMQLDPRDVFFSLTSDDGADPFGAAGVRLVAGRSLAVDPAYHAMGELLWVDASVPALTGAWPAYRRLGVALDTGGAIKGQARADLYVGRGEAAGVEAGRIRHVLSLYRLVPTPRAGE